MESVSDTAQLTLEQKVLLELLEKNFKARYTEADEDYRRVLNMEAVGPPIVERWLQGQRGFDRGKYKRSHERPYSRDNRHNEFERRSYHSNPRRHNPY